MGHSGQRWLTGRLIRSPFSVFVKFGGGAYRLLPPTQLVSLGFKLVAPFGDLLPHDPKEPSMYVQDGNKVVIYLKELGESFVAIMSPEHSSTSDSPVYFDPMSRTIWELEDASNATHPQEASASEVCFLVDVSPFRGRGDNGSTQTLRAARFLVHNRHTNSLHCQYDKLVAFKASKADATHNASNMIRMSNDTSISMDFGKFSAGLQTSGRLLTL